MNEQHKDHRFAEAGGVEAMLAAAGNYVGASEDLRPRVLEAVKQHHQRTRRRNRLAVAGGGVLLVALFSGLQAATLGDRLKQKSTSERVAQLVEADADEPYRAGVDGLCWRLVDAVLAVRSEQAEAFSRDDPSAASQVLEPADELAAQNGEARTSY